MVAKGYFDGKVIVPDQPLELPTNQRVVFDVEADSPGPAAPRADECSALDWAAKNAVDGASLPSDLAHQHDHYLYGTPKKP